MNLREALKGIYAIAPEFAHEYEQDARHNYPAYVSAIDKAARAAMQGEKNADV